MENLGKIYHELTSVDIEEQKRLWDERGKGYWGEYQVFTKLYQNISGQAKILMNLNIPTEYGDLSGTGKTTEIDLLMIHESGLYSFEIKHYKGTIYGKYSDNYWTQYFRTQDNSRFNSPIKQNEYHIEALRKLFPSLPIYSYIVFTHEDAVIKVTGWQDTGVVVCRLEELLNYINKINALNSDKISPEKIDEIFHQLKSFAPIMQKKILVDGKEVLFAEYVNAMKDDFASSLKDCQVLEKKRYKKKVGSAVGVALIVSALMIIFAMTSQVKANSKVAAAEQEKSVAEQKMKIFAQKFKYAEPFADHEIKLVSNFVEAYDVELKKSADITDLVTFSCKLQVNGEQYGIHVTKASSVIVQMKDGSVEEFPLRKLGNGYYDYIVGPFGPYYYNTVELPEIQVFTDSVENIKHIKLINVTLCKGPDFNKALKTGVEFTLYTDS